MGVAEAAQETPCHPDSEGVDEFLPKEALGHGVEDEGTLTGESDQSPLRIDFQEFLQIKFFDSHASFLD